MVDKTKGNNTGDALTGMKAICNYMNRSEPTVLDLIRDRKFPATKIGGVWESGKTLIDGWKKAQIFSEVFKSQEAV